ncbi:hypothetical protein Q428_10340 [Fervidicella metallireducens AeB]|uniref:Thiamin/hydroxymethyl pyrimidine-binding YkoF putative domain-containing protein n=1 Tax=Fervidicella metallireducens AeB TaxID=1403537 RepID=A0A017RT87_9CLOT|nr:YkoF family thiamine/hydroxymethylpyrimidine-binding protein [Fervidicella metallireducens]EYE87963.1 hypothetical protein Q428_10340 [Fervidicella metallireducens AeB]
MLCAEISLYPLGTNHANSIIKNSIRVLDTENVDYKVGSISTHLHGPDEDVWKSIEDMYRHAAKNGEVNMVITVTNAGKNL